MNREPLREVSPGRVNADLRAWKADGAAADATAYASAPFGRRALAYAIDAFIFFAFVGALEPLVRAAFGERAWRIAGGFGGILFALYFALSHFNDGQTFGKKICKIKTMPNGGGELLSLPQILLRETAGRALALLLWPTLLISALLPSKRALHDWIARTRVVRTD